MCGISGYFGFSRDTRVDRELVSRMNATLFHRGPDGDGQRDGSGYTLAHRRLAIVDLQGGLQPMATPDERLWVTFNGEIYNYLALREELEQQGFVFRTQSCTGRGTGSARSRSTGASTSRASRSPASSRRCASCRARGDCGPTRWRSSWRCATSQTR
jgi:glutamine phosphoribosylpyrophosphate amidotransferase